ncbi:PREDICTED: P2X purinoceptor 3 [Gavialis gangeticus]|uniref:P2X purinoceptor 3 n=1 Tax=Gavialis gangeticus TaxID=94835 RepID=UPI00092F636A|nr:PREDICTED: P2X purinoceptor 3 [Gavialis gangeticus]
MPTLSSRMNCVANFFTYETTKSVVVKSWTIGVINRAVQLLIVSYFIGWVFLHEKAYQVRDTAIESSVVTKVKGFGKYANQVMDVVDYVTPPQPQDILVSFLLDLAKLTIYKTRKEFLAKRNLSKGGAIFLSLFWSRPQAGSLVDIHKLL